MTAASHPHGAVRVQLVRGVVSLPHGTGRERRVAVFVDTEEDAAAARAAGAALVGGDDLVADVAANKGLAADAVIATPAMQARLGKVARILGPRCAFPLSPPSPPPPHVAGAPSRTRARAPRAGASCRAQSTAP